ncbi:hypothetical protein [Haloplanus aerogenes]|uniref:Uncharacterized protein n=1 Tax=Haloplanus aerogenes TaxID=660522 RepID=A0A3M0CZL5_9EURY|nr:hypothetical protein [Haloplanus aerogenes]AZH26707.1 hypothetical protein DU502_15570 [Haloplanus aerogenes]RMB12949.1 hypothetical protein ATH50_3105 [Haloplanus aerogenes]
MQLTQNNVEDFVEGVFDFYNENTLLGEANSVREYGSANLPTKTRERSAKLKVQDFSAGIAHHNVKPVVNEITSFEQSKLLNWFEQEHDAREQVGSNEFSPSLTKTVLGSLDSPVQVLLPDKMEYRYHIDNGTHLQGNRNIPITWFPPNQYDQTGFAVDRGGYVLQKQQGDTSVVDDSLNIDLPNDYSKSWLVLKVDDDPSGGVEVTLRSEFTSLQKSDEYDSVCLLDLPSLNVP